MTVGILAANLLAGRLTDGIGAPRTMLAGIVAMIVACVDLLWLDRATGYPLLFAEQAVLGGGLGLFVPPMTGTLMTSVERSRSGVASGTLTTCARPAACSASHYSAVSSLGTPGSTLGSRLQG